MAALAAAFTIAPTGATAAVDGWFALQPTACGIDQADTQPLASAPYAGPVNHATLTPAFRWGWFGAERRTPAPQWHRTYHGEVIRWQRHVGSGR